MDRKAKAKMSTILIVILALLAIGFIVGKTGILFSISGAETMTRIVPTTPILPSSTFQVTYTAVGTIGNYGVSVIDNMSGGCTSSQGAFNKFVLTSPATTYQVTVTAPASGSCVFIGDYQYGTSAIKTFPTATVTICQPMCTRPANLCLASSSNGCGGTCTWTVTKNTDSDTNCDNVVSRDELGVSITSWIAGTTTRDALGQAIVAWIGTG